MSLDPPIEASPGGGDHLFVRQATGLVRELSLTDNVVLSASYISVFLGVTYLTLVPSTFTGANIALAFALTFALCVPHYVTYGWLSSAMPRSGGDYLFLSRVVHPLAGFVVNGIISLVFIAGLGNVALTVPQFGLPAMFESLAFITGNSRWDNYTSDVTSQAGQVWIAGALIVITGVISLFSVRAVARWAIGLFIVGLVGAVAALISLLTVSPSGFVRDFHRVGSVHKIVAAAHGDGVFPNHADTGALFASFIILSVAIGYGYIPTYWGGEVRQARSKMLPAMLAGAALATGLLVLIAILAVHVMGADFLGAAGYVTFAHPEVWPFPSQPALYALITISHPHSWLAVLLGVSFVAGITGTILPSYLMLTRNSLAWAIDRVVPPIFGEVSPRTHTPLFSTLFMIVVSVGYLLLAVYHWASDIVLLFAIVALMAIFVWMCTGIAAVLFPYTARKMFEDSPVNRRVGGIPLLSIVGAIDAAIMAYFIYITMFTHWGELAGLKTSTAVEVMAIEIAGLTAIWLAAFAVSKRRGISLTLAQQALPPE